MDGIVRAENIWIDIAAAFPVAQFVVSWANFSFLVGFDSVTPEGVTLLPSISCPGFFFFSLNRRRRRARPQRQQRCSPPTFASL